MPRRTGDHADDRFLKANLNDPDNQAALLRAYLELKRTTEDLSDKLAQASGELSRQESSRAEETRLARESGLKEVEVQKARLDRMSAVMRLVRWAGEWSGKGATFLVGTGQDLSQVVALAAANADTSREIRYDKAADRWVITWEDGRAETILAVTPKSDEAPAQRVSRRRRPTANH